MSMLAGILPGIQFIIMVTLWPWMVNSALPLLMLSIVIPLVLTYYIYYKKYASPFHSSSGYSMDEGDADY